MYTSSLSRFLFRSRTLIPRTTTISLSVVSRATLTCTPRTFFSSSSSSSSFLPQRFFSSNAPSTSSSSSSSSASDPDSAFDISSNTPSSYVDSLTSLSIQGGNAGREARRLKTLRIQDAVQKLFDSNRLRDGSVPIRTPLFDPQQDSSDVKAPTARIAKDDIVAVSDTMVMIGTGRSSNHEGVLTMFREGVWEKQGVKQVVVVRDVFDRHPSRDVLSKTFRMLTDDVTGMVKSIQRSPNRRLVNVYKQSALHTQGKPYILEKHDVDFVEFLHDLGYRVIPFDSQEELFQIDPEDPLKYIKIQQSTNHVLMVAPTAFELNPHAAEDNHFMNQPDNMLDNIQDAVLKEFERLHYILTNKREGAGLRVHLFSHEAHHNTPDAVFPNNWFSTHTDLEVGECTLCLYPMRAPNRRLERRPDFLRRLHGFKRYTHVYDLTRQEDAKQPKFLEGTGSLVLDRINKIAYLAVSERSDPSLAKMWSRAMGYTPVLFDSVDAKHRPIYHTNVLMSVGTSVAVLCTQSIPNPKQRDMVIDSLKSTGHDLVDISFDQMNAFCGNVLEVENFYGHPVMVMSTQAYKAFTQEQRDMMLQHEDALLHADISTIERVGGGGVRCSIGELF